MKPLRYLAILTLAASAAAPLVAQTKTETVTTVLQGVRPQKAKASHLWSRVDEVYRLIGEKKFDEADGKAATLRKDYEKTFDSSLKQFSFQSQAEFDEFNTAGAGKFEWIDWGYKQCLQAMAYLAAQRRDFPASLAILKTLENTAPVSAAVTLEAGYVLNQVGRPTDGLATYRRGLALAEKYPSQRVFRAPALRGIGFSLIELKRLDEAEDAFQKSLKVEPGNKIALHELEYIRDVRAAK